MYAEAWHRLNQTFVRNMQPRYHILLKKEIFLASPADFLYHDPYDTPSFFFIKNAR
ncbi:MAG: hypothetical protein JWM20_687 [Patescibacteria group bacterium]|nr:hypothetical protein [Patescibacteria group bacterium]